MSLLRFSLARSCQPELLKKEATSTCSDQGVSALTDMELLLENIGFEDNMQVRFLQAPKYIVQYIISQKVVYFQAIYLQKTLKEKKG
jgi:hypothetical protein